MTHILKRVLRLSVRFLLLAVVIWCATEVAWRNYAPTSKPLPRQEVWAHRCFSPLYLENTIAGLRYNVAAGAKGIEMDVFYDDSLQNFVVSHEFPYLKADGKLLLLREVFENIKDSTQYWLDFKNLSYNNQKNADKVLTELVNSHQLANKVFIESHKGWLLRGLCHPPLRTIYWAYYENRPPIFQPLKIWSMKLLLMTSDFDALDTFYDSADDRYRAIFDKYPTFICYANGETEVKNSLKRANLVAVLVDSSQYFRYNK